MARQGEMHEVLAYDGATSTGTSDIKSLTPPARAVGVWVTVETTDARMTFDGTAPGVSIKPGMVIKKDAVPQFYPFPFDAVHVVKFAANSAASSVVSVLFVF